MVAGLWATCCCDGKGGRGGGGLTTVLCRGWEGGGFLHPYCRGGGVQEAQPVGATWMLLQVSWLNSCWPAAPFKLAPGRLWALCCCFGVRGQGSGEGGRGVTLSTGGGASLEPLHT
jgi:hypothetical protein